MGSGRRANAGGGTGECAGARAWREFVVKAAKFHYNYRDPDEQVEDKTRPATPEKLSAE